MFGQAAPAHPHARPVKIAKAKDPGGRDCGPGGRDSYRFAVFISVFGQQTDNTNIGAMAQTETEH
jgi:hypothetical protein